MEMLFYYMPAENGIWLKKIILIFYVLYSIIHATGLVQLFLKNSVKISIVFLLGFSYNEYRLNKA